MSDDPFLMMYCDTASCRVNTFEQGDGSDSGLCTPTSCRID